MVQSSLALGNQPDGDGFTQWLAEHVGRDARSAATISKAAGLGVNTVPWLLRNSTKQPTERTVRTLAAFFGVDGDELAAQAGYRDTSVGVPDPRQFPTIANWLLAALEARRESKVGASQAMGLSRNAISEIIRKGGTTRPTADKIADYFGVDRGLVRAFITKHVGRVSAGKELASRLGPEHFARMREAGASKLAEVLTPEKRVEIGRIAGAAVTRQRSPADWKRFSELGRATSTRQAEQRGTWFVTDDARKRHAEHSRRVGVLGGYATLERHGREHMRKASAVANAKRRNGEYFRCLFCGDADRLLYRNLSRQRISKGVYHRSCYDAWRRGVEMREMSRKLGAIGWIASRLHWAEDEVLKEDVQQRILAQLSYLRKPNRRGRPPTLLDDKDLAIALALLHHEGESAISLALLAGLDVDRRADGVQVAGPRTWRLIRFGKALLSPDFAKSVSKNPDDD